MKRTVKKKIIIIFVICAAVILGMFLYIIFRYQNTSPERLPGKYSPVIPQVHSMTDKDGDGIDDQADILQSALDYIAAKPKYKSKYYRTGYPDDGYVIHHNSPWQKKYEQDILEKREDLVGHYRISQ